VSRGVGPVLRAGAIARIVVEILKEAHPDAVVVDRGAYLRVLVGSPCVLTAAAVENRTGEPFHLPQDLEKIMVSFQGRLTLSQREAVWESEAHG
jgi:MmoB/DmpM family